MRAPIAVALAGAALAAQSLPSPAQDRLPTTTRSERQIIETNRTLEQQGRGLNAAQQNQFEVNQLRQDLSRNAISGPPPVSAPRICPPGAIAC